MQSSDTWRRSRDSMKVEYHCTLKEVAEELGLSTTHVKNIERQALEKLRRFFEIEGYDEKYLTDDLK